MLGLADPFVAGAPAPRLAVGRSAEGGAAACCDVDASVYSPTRRRFASPVDFSGVKLSLTVGGREEPKPDDW